jgi:hypothetical protein
MGLVMGIRVALSAPMVSHLFFVDDSLLLFKANRENAETVNNALDLYNRASGQQVNLEKLSIHFAKGCSNATCGEIKAILQVHNEALSERYLGMPTDVGSFVSKAFSYLKDREWKKVQGWMEPCLSAGGKEVLIKAVAQAIPTIRCRALCFEGVCASILIAFYVTSGGQQRRKKEDLLGHLG